MSVILIVFRHLLIFFFMLLINLVFVVLSVHV
jgi:hypothetical protein